MKIYSNGKDRVLTGEFPARFKLLNAGVDVPFIRTGKQTIRLSGDIPFGELDVEEVIRKKTPQPAKLDAQSIAVINKADFDKIDILSKKLAINQEQMNAHLSALTEQEATLANLETQNAQDINQTNLNMAEMAKAFGKEIQADRDALVATSENIKQVLSETAEVFGAKLTAHEVAKNPHKITKAMVGLDAVDNTSDIDKPVSKATQKALDKKADKSDIENLDKRLLESDKKQDTLMRNLETVNLYGGVGGNELPTGGTKGQVLKKKSNKDGDYEWSSTGGGGVTVHNDLTGRSASGAHPISAITNLQTTLSGKQDTISDLDAIRSGASLGATSIQPNDNVSELVNDANYATTTEVSTAVSDHNSSQDSHSYIRGLITSETTNRENADISLQSQIDAITASSDVKDIVGTYAELQAYDTSTLGNNDIIKVLQDETHDNETTYYRWSTSTETFSLIGEEGPYYTKSEADSTFVPQTRTVNGKALSSDITLSASDVSALPSSTVIPSINPTNNYVPYRSGSSAFSNSTLIYNSNAMAFTGKLHIGSSSPGTYYSKGRLTIYDNTPDNQVSSLALLNYGGGGGCGVAIDMYNTSANGGIPSGRFGVVDNGNYSGYLQLQVKKSGSQNNQLLPAMNIVPVPASNSLTTCVSFGQSEFNRVLFDLHRPEATCSITDADKRWTGSGTTYYVSGTNKFNQRLMVAVGDIVSFDGFTTEATVTGVVSDSSTLQITTNQTLGTVSGANISVRKAYFKVTDENDEIKVYINPYGKMGIGTGIPAYELDVSGSINATDIKKNGVSIPTTVDQSYSSTSTNAQSGTAVDQAVSSCSNTSLSNLTSAGKNIGNWSSNVSNCLTEIPQDIKLELSSGTLTLKSGSKVTASDGTQTTTSEDKTYTASGSSTYAGLVIVSKSTGSIQSVYDITKAGSGSSLPANGNTYTLFLNTTDNNIYRWSSGAWSTWGVALPVAICTVTSGTITSIDQVFNGFGYIGSTVFALPGIKGLIPNGRNSDGTLKSSSLETTSLLTNTLSSDNTNTIVLSSSGISCQSFPTGWNYYEAENMVKNSSGQQRSFCVVGSITSSSAKIQSIETKQAFRSFDYSDFKTLFDNYLKGVSGYSSSSNQTLTHDTSGNLLWVNS